jgi:hypothetical protein
VCEWQIPVLDYETIGVRTRLVIIAAKQLCLPLEDRLPKDSLDMLSFRVKFLAKWFKRGKKNELGLGWVGLGCFVDSCLAENQDCRPD